MDSWTGIWVSMVMSTDVLWIKSSSNESLSRFDLFPFLTKRENSSELLHCVITLRFAACDLWNAASQKWSKCTANQNKAILYVLLPRFHWHSHAICVMMLLEQTCVNFCPANMQTLRKHLKSMQSARFAAVFHARTYEERTGDRNKRNRFHANFRRLCL